MTIPTTLIYFADNVKRGFMGSAISVAAEDGDGENKLATNAATKQVFCRTAIV